MIPKSAHRFSEKITLKQNVTPAIRAAGYVFIASLLAGCAGGALENSAPAAAPTEMAGRWILAAPDAPSCGMNFGGTPGTHRGTVTPEGGCPGKFFTSQRWTLEQGALLINDYANQRLAHLTFANGRFEGQDTAGMAVTLAP
jgi:Protease inhibitor Inh